ncbi:MAG: hypothetical protein JW715_02485 [Sedimentisphaerales bacterium]|nr:hypothetical protein [Sedimentisphaerales bacterium]
MSGKEILISILIIICCAGITAAYIYKYKSREKEEFYPVNEFSPEYRENMGYLLDVVLKEKLDLPDGWTGYFGSHIPVVKKQDFPWFIKMLKKEFWQASGSALYHRIVVGGMNSLDIDRPLLEASERIRPSGRPNIEIVIVAPTTISGDTKQILEKRGLQITIIENQQQ